MKKKVLATACLMSLAVSQAAFADDYVTGDRVMLRLIFRNRSRSGKLV